MAKEIENLDSPKEELDGQEEEPETEVAEETDDSAALKEKLEKVQKSNTQLFERAKKAEGFVKDDSGKWAKKPVEQEKPEPKKEAPVIDKPIEDRKLDEMLDAKLEKREISNLEISDSLKKEVGAYVKLNGGSVKEALASPYIQFRIGEAKDAEDTEEASLGGGKGKTAKENISEPGTFDLSTDEGKAKFKKWEEKVKKDLG